jgi:hypothetical protein
MRKFVLVAAMVLVSAGAQAGQVRSLSLAGSDSKAVQDSAKTSESASVVETPKASRATDVTGVTDNSKSVERPKFVERPPGVDVRKQRQQQSQMADGAPHRRQSAHMSMSHRGTHRAGHIHLNTSRIVAALHRHGIYW